MRKKRFDKKKMLLLVPALACSLATGLQNAAADTAIFADGTYLTNTTTPNLPYNIAYADTLVLLEGAEFYATGSENAVIVGSIFSATGVTINNSGLISAENASAIYIDATATGTSITNFTTGVISSTITGTTNASVATVNFAGALDTSLVNEGTISAAASASNGEGAATAYATGIYINNLTVAGSINNSGEITASANASATTAYAYAAGIWVESGVASSLTNIGSISATADASGSGALATANGIGINGNLTGSLANSGTISATAIAEGNAPSADATGVYMEGILAGTLFNSIGGTISATAYADGSSAHAYANGVEMGGNLAGSLSNSGTISASATATGTSSYAAAYAHGINIGGNLSGSLSNSGTISANASATAYYTAKAYAYGVSMVDLSATGSLSNSGTISASATANNFTGSSSVKAYAYGVNLTGNLDGSLSNSGTISASASAYATSGPAYANAYGVTMVDLSAATNTLSNSGTISASATATGTSSYAFVYARGIDMTGNLAGSLSNSGTISASATATAYSIANAYAYGVSMDDLSATGSLANSNQITATATADSYYYTANAYAYGVDLLGNLEGSLTNTSTGTISASATAGASSGPANAYAYGVNLYGNLDGSLSNSGIISASATADSTVDAAYATGITVGGILAGSLTNTSTGTISAFATANGFYSGHASAAGISVQTIDGAGVMTNSGTINATAIATGGEGGATANAYGIYADIVAAPIIVLAQNGPLDAGIEGNLVNTGTITASATASASDSASASYAYGVYVSTLDGTVANDGTITGIADLPEDGYSLYVNGGSGVINNYTHGVLNGNLYVGGTVTVNNSGTINLPAMEVGMGISGGIKPLGMSSAFAYIAGNYNQTTIVNGIPQGLLVFGATSPEKYGSLVVGGTATFAPDANLKVNLTYGNTVTKDSIMRVITADTLVSDGFKVTDNSALLSFDYTVNPDNTVDLITVQEFGKSMVGAVGWSSALGAAGALDHMLGVYGTEDAYTGMNTVLADLRAMETDEQVALAIVTTLPSLRLELPRLTLENMHHGIDLTREREDSVRGLSSGAGLVENGYLWMSGLGSSASQSNANGAFGYDSDTYGFMIGGDKAIGERARIGLAFGFSHSDVDGDTLASQSADVKSYQPLLYGSYALDNQVNLTMHLGYGWHDNEITRYVPLAGTTFKGDYDASSINAGIAASRSYKMDEKTIITPSVRLDYGYIDNDSYSENSPNALSLAVSDSSVDELILGIDAKVAHKLNHDWNITGKIGLGYDMLADEDSVNSSYAGAPGVSFSTHGTDPSSWLYRGGVGVVYGKPDTLEVSLRYDLEGREDFTNQSVSIKLGKSF